MKKKVFECYPMMRSTAFERRMVFERDADHSSLAIQYSGFFDARARQLLVHSAS